MAHTCLIPHARSSGNPELLITYFRPASSFQRGFVAAIGAGLLTSGWLRFRGSIV